ncbi:MAG: hypothetical protein FJZ87_16385 [Chloroflexi bacterium]|nr:hypothetical protein [Chloroflexota bacterium]
MNTAGSVVKAIILLGITGLGGCLAGYALGSGEDDPAGIEWQQVSSPPERPVQIISMEGIGGDELGMTIEGSSGIQYECCGIWPWLWREAKSRRERSLQPCPEWENSPLSRAPGKIDDCGFVQQWEWVIEEHYVVLLEDGSLWRWRYYEGMTVISRYAGWGMLIGFIAGIFLLFRRSREPAR